MDVQRHGAGSHGSRRLACEDLGIVGLNVYARLDETSYPQKIKITNEQIAAVNITGHQFHPEWNYKIRPSVVNS